MTSLPCTRHSPATSPARCRWACKPAATAMFPIGRCRAPGPTKKYGCIRWHAGSGSCATLPVRRSLKDRPTRRSSSSPLTPDPGAVIRAIPRTDSSGPCCRKANTPCAVAARERDPDLPARRQLHLGFARRPDIRLRDFQAPVSRGEVRIRVSARGDGRHRFRLRTDNLTLSEVEKEIDLANREPQGRPGVARQHPLSRHSLDCRGLCR